MVSQLLPTPLLPRALLPASSLEPLEAEERVLCSFERVRVAAGAADDDAAAAETDGHAVGTLHVTSRCDAVFCSLFFLVSREATTVLIVTRSAKKEKERERKS